MAAKSNRMEQEYRGERDVIYLASCAVQERIPDQTRINQMDLDAVYRLASRHLITAVIAFALESADYKDSRSANAIAAAMRKAVLFDREWKEIKSRLNAEGIWYMPLKGAVLKDFYPKLGMRQFADHDILIDPARAADVKDIFESMGYSTESYGSSNHDVYHKLPCFNFEMHTALFGPSHEVNLYEYYRNVDKRLVKCREDGCERRFLPEDFYLYMLAHEYKHYTGGGTGLRSLLDTYVYLKKMGDQLDFDYIKVEAVRLGIRDFEKQNRLLAIHLFDQEELTAEDKDMLAYILSSGTYGTITNQVQNKMRKNGWGKLQYMLNRFLVPVSRKNKAYAMYAGAYPFFYRHKILLPVLPFYRTIRSIKRGNFRAEARAICKAKKRKSEKPV